VALLLEASRVTNSRVMDENIAELNHGENLMVNVRSANGVLWVDPTLAGICDSKRIFPRHYHHFGQRELSAAERKVSIFMAALSLEQGNP